MQHPNSACGKFQTLDSCACGGASLTPGGEKVLAVAQEDWKGVYYIIYLSIYVICVYTYTYAHTQILYIYMYTCKTPSEWWLGRSTIIRHGSRRFQGITQESTRVDRCLDWRAASQASRGAVLRSAGDLCFLVVLVITSPLKSNMETKSKGLEDSFLLEPFYCGVCMGVEAFPRTRQSGGRLRWYGYIYIYQIYDIYIYILYWYIYIWVSIILYTYMHCTSLCGGDS